MQFKKIRQVLDGQTEGDYYGYDTDTLNTILKAISPDIQLMGTDESTQLSFTVICPAEYESAVRDAVIAHGTEAAVEARKVAKEKAENNAPIFNTIVQLEDKALRAIREQTINTAIAINDLDSCNSLADVKAWLKANLALESWKEGSATKTIQDFDNEIKAERGKLK